MKNTHPNIVVLFLAFLFSQTVFSQHSECPKVLDESIQLYQSAHAAVACEYDVVGKCINSFAKVPLLSEQLYFFDTRFRTNGVELIWQSKMTYANEIFKILRSRDGEQFHEIAEINSSDFEDGQITYLDNLPMLGNNYYLLKKVEDGKTLISNQQSVYVSLGMCHLETMNVKNEKDEVNMKYFVDNSGLFQLLVTDTEGHEQARKNVAMKAGKNDIQFSLPTNGIYFVTLTNGFSSVTDLVIQSKGSDSSKSSVAKTDEESNSNK
ncbi:MAG: hypothetical protein AB8H03_01745 [Saprospiraceae bacterium]